MSPTNLKEQRAKIKEKREWLKDWAETACAIRLDAEARNFHFIALCAGVLEQAALTELPVAEPAVARKAANDTKS